MKSAAPIDHCSNYVQTCRYVRMELKDTKNEKILILTKSEDTMLWLLTPLVKVLKIPLSDCDLESHSPESGIKIKYDSV